MRIIGGRFRRAQLRVPAGLDVRPTADRVREALFSALEARVDVADARVLDLFAGTGALGLEALSRGAATAVFVEASAPAARVLQQNAAALGVGPQATLVRADALAWLARAARSPGVYDLVFADPPYDLPRLPALPALVRPLLAAGGLFALEHDARHAFEPAPGLVWTRAYGRTVVSVFGPEEQEGDEPPTP